MAGGEDGRRGAGGEKWGEAPHAKGENDVRSEGEGSFSCPAVPVQGPEDENPNSTTPPGDERSSWGLCPAQEVLEVEGTG